MTDMFTANRQPPLPTASEFETITTALGIVPGFKILFSPLAQRLFQREDVADIIDAASLPAADSDCRHYKLTPVELHGTVRAVLAHLAWHYHRALPLPADQVARVRAFAAPVA
ncbi:MAG: hypothetical protein Q7T73_02670 [Beijerinckiaceae bacterium]|nr:hypothetical protein [Beijerinckiaceae bacterium]